MCFLLKAKNEHLKSISILGKCVSFGLNFADISNDTGMCVDDIMCTLEWMDMLHVSTDFPPIYSIVVQEEKIRQFAETYSQKSMLRAMPDKLLWKPVLSR